MSISQTTPEETSIGHLFCPQCNAALPLRATFCGSCGERVRRKKQSTVFDEQDINARYRITTLVRRRPHINLYFAMDHLQSSANAQPRMVAIRDIDIAGLSKEARVEAIALAQQEYDRLRQWHIPHLLASIEIRVFQEHLFLISGIPFLPRETATAQVPRLHTLQDFLQSGQGLPKESRALAWVRSLCQTVERLHRQQIVLGDLDPYTVVLNKNSVEAEPRLMVSWMLPELQKLLRQSAESPAPQVSYFSAPEALAGRAEAASDVYSLGALLYLLLTGTPPDESTLRNRRRLRSPREINGRINPQVDECVMQALALDPRARFSSADALMAALENARLFLASAKLAAVPSVQPRDVNPADAETVRIIPLSQKDLARWRAAREQAAIQNTQIMPTMQPPVATLLPQPGSNERKQGAIGPLPVTPMTPYPGRNVPAQQAPGIDERDTPPSTPAAQKPAWKKRLTGILPAIKPEQSPAPAKKPAKSKAKKPEQNLAPSKQKASPPRKAPKVPEHASEISLLKQIQRLVLGEQQHSVEAAAIIETPMRIRPDQSYNIRLHIVGRDEPTPHPGAKKGERPAGLSALIHGETIQVEVRSVLQQGYTYVLQQATVTIPASGYAAEITIPMQPQSGIAAGRRDRLHVFFLDGQRRPLYEKPFVVEVFISPLVQLGREGHQVLAIPI